MIQPTVRVLGRHPSATLRDLRKHTDRTRRERLGP